MRRLKLLVIGYWLLVIGFDFAQAQEITILYTGETHAMLYPCSCPEEPDGGVARRAKLISQLRKNNPHALLLDSGGFFAGGLLDEYTQNTQLDMQRTQINLKAMQFIEYDAVAVGDNEFNFGREFLEENIGKTNLTFLSCNIKSQLFLPYLIKEIAGTKIGIIGITGLSARNKAEGMEFIEPKVALNGAMQELKNKGVNFIVVLSQLGEHEDLRLIREIEGIDILIAGRIISSKKELSIKTGSTLMLKPSWQGRRLNKLSLLLKDDKIANYKVESIRLSNDIPDDADVLSILPRCFSDSDCKKEGLLGMCKDAGMLKSQCLFTEASKVSLLIITPKVCSVCDTERLVKYLKSQFPGLVVSYLYYPDNAKAKRLLENFVIGGLPVYLLGKEIEKEKSFETLKPSLDLKGDFYVLRHQFSGLSYFINRKRIKGRLDLFISLYDKNTAILLDMLKDFNPAIHFLAIEKHGGFDSRYGNLEVEDYLRSVCVQKYYPQVFWQYISCRAKFIDSSWWEDCLGNLDTDKITFCSRGDEGKQLLRENIGLNKDLEIMFGPVYLLENVEIFSTLGEPSREELEKIIKR